MKKIKIYASTVLFLIFLQSCGTVREGFSSQKKNSSDEFLVEKKSPLVIPPDFDELPVPNTSEAQLEENSSSIKSIITANEKTTVSSQNKTTDQNLESSILKKIKNN